MLGAAAAPGLAPGTSRSGGTPGGLCQRVNSGDGLGGGVQAGMVLAKLSRFALAAWTAGQGVSSGRSTGLLRPEREGAELGTPGRPPQPAGPQRGSWSAAWPRVASDRVESEPWQSGLRGYGVNRGPGPPDRC